MNKQYFKVPIETDYGTGWWYGEFDGQWISRQIEIYLDRDEALVGGRDIDLLDQPLSVMDLVSSFNAKEIAGEEFESIWHKYS